MANLMTMAAVASGINSHNDLIKTATQVGRVLVTDYDGNKSVLYVWHLADGSLYYLCSNHAQMPQAASNVFNRLPAATTAAGRNGALLLCKARCKYNGVTYGLCSVTVVKGAW